jgi:hypothetical protein
MKEMGIEEPFEKVITDANSSKPLHDSSRLLEEDNPSNIKEIGDA